MNNSTNRFFLPMTVALLLGSAACGDEDAPTNELPATTAGSVANYLVNDGRFTVLVELAQRSGLLNDLDDLSGAYTVFAPTDAAFNALPDDFLVTQNFVSNGNPDLLTTELSAAGLQLLVEAHVVAETLVAEEVLVSTRLDTLAGEASVTVFDPTPDGDLISEQNDEFPIIDGRAQVIQADQTRQNGVVHVIDSVLVPTAELADIGDIDADEYPGTLFGMLEATPLFRPFLEALRSAGAADILADIADSETERAIFIPLLSIDPSANNAADLTAVHVVVAAVETGFEGLGASVDNDVGVRLAVVDSAEERTIENAEVLLTDVVATNGRVHLIRQPIVPPDQTLADRISVNRSLSTFSGLLADNDLLDDLRDDSTTVAAFGPVNDAFERLGGLVAAESADGPVTYLDVLLADSDALQEVLQYHLAEGPVDLSVDEEVVTNLDGRSFPVTVVNDATTLVDGLMEVVGERGPADGDDENQSTVYSLGNVLLPEVVVDALELEVLQVNFPGSTAEALGYFSVLNAYAALVEVPAPAELPLEVEDDVGEEVSATFGGTLLQLFGFVPADVTKPEEDQAFPGEFEAPYVGRVEPDPDGGGDPIVGNFAPAPTTVFVPVGSALSTGGLSLDDFVFTQLSDAAKDDGFSTADFVRHHTVVDALPAEDLLDGSLASTLVADASSAGSYVLEFIVDGDGEISLAQEGDAVSVVYPDLRTENGVIHLVNTPVFPIFPEGN